MIAEETPIDGAKILRLRKNEDSRGSFARLWCSSALKAMSLAHNFVQANVVFTHSAGTIRGLHYQVEPAAEDKLIRCTRGAIFDVVVDLRPDSATYLKWFGMELSSGDDTLFYAPRGCAHGYQALRDDTEAEYFVTSAYSPERERGIRWDDPFFAIAWPERKAIVSEKDNNWPDFQGHSVE